MFKKRAFSVVVGAFFINILMITLMNFVMVDNSPFICPTIAATNEFQIASILGACFLFGTLKRAGC